jgi:hypothetical protein
MIEFLIALLGAAIAFACLMPLLKTGAQMIAAFMRHQHIAKFSTAMLAQLMALFGGALLAISVSQGSQDPSLRLIGAVLMLATVYAANWLIQKTLLKDLL